jgi:hypothetical protein
MTLAEVRSDNRNPRSLASSLQRSGGIMAESNGYLAFPGLQKSDVVNALRQLDLPTKFAVSPSCDGWLPIFGEGFTYIDGIIPEVALALCPALKSPALGIRLIELSCFSWWAFGADGTLLAKSDAIDPDYPSERERRGLAGDLSVLIELAGKRGHVSSSDLHELLESGVSQGALETTFRLGLPPITSSFESILDEFDDQGPASPEEFTFIGVDLDDSRIAFHELTASDVREMTQTSEESKLIEPNRDAESGGYLAFPRLQKRKVAKALRQLALPTKFAVCPNYDGWLPIFGEGFAYIDGRIPEIALQVCPALKSRALGLRMIEESSFSWWAFEADGTLLAKSDAIDPKHPSERERRGLAGDLSVLLELCGNCGRQGPISSTDLQDLLETRADVMQALATFTIRLGLPPIVTDFESILHLMTANKRDLRASPDEFTFIGTDLDELTRE